MADSRPPFPPFTGGTAVQKIRGAEDAWKHAIRIGWRQVTIDYKWRNCAEIFQGRDNIVAFLIRKWRRELEYRLIKELWAFADNRIAVRFAYEFHDDSGNWDGLNVHRLVSINDLPIKESNAKFHWDRSAPRPPGSSRVERS